MKSNDLRPGMAIKLDDQLFMITQFQHVTPGNLRAFCALKIKNLNTGSIVDKRLRSGDEIERVDLDRREMEYLYSDPSGATFMDTEDYDQAVIPADILGDAMLYLRPNTTITVLCHDGNPISVDLPGSVELTVTDTSPQVKGATATNQLKEAECETGLKIRVPPFIEIGESVKVSTADGSYMSRAKGD